jgi:hypothetical protein
MYLKANGDAKQWLLPIDKTVAFRHGQAHGYRFVGWGVRFASRLVRLCSGTPTPTRNSFDGTELT